MNEFPAIFAQSHRRDLRLALISGNLVCKNSELERTNAYRKISNRINIEQVGFSPNAPSSGLETSDPLIASGPLGIDQQVE